MPSIESLKESGQQSLQDYEDKIRESPIPAVLIAAVVGFFFPLKTLAALLAFVLRIALGLLKPAVLVFGVYKAVEYIRANAPAASDPAPAPSDAPAPNVDQGPPLPPPGL